MTPDWVPVWAFNLVAEIIPWVIAGYALIQNGRLGRRKERIDENALYASKATVSAQATKVDDHEKRLAAVEAQLRHMPTHEDMTGLRTDLAEVKGTMTGMTQAVSSMNNSLQLITETLMRREGEHVR